MAVPVLKLDAAAALLAAYGAPQGEAGWAVAARSAASGRFGGMGAPARRDEYWRFTNPAELTALPAPRADASAERAEAGIVFVDGVAAPELSNAPAIEGVEVEPLGRALAADIHWARGLYGALEAMGQDPVDRPLAALNTARAKAGLAVRVTGQAAGPLRIVYRQEDAGSDTLIHHVIRLEPGADLSVIETGVAGARSNVVLEVEVADGASFHHVRTQGRDHTGTAFSAIFARLGRGSAFKSFTLGLNGRLTRNECVVRFGGDDAHATVSGASIGEGAFHNDDTVFVTHDAVGCESRQVFKKVLRSGAVGVFQGKILVRPGAQKTDGYQISQGLLLDEDSQFLAKPELEIYADDVACSHGATVGAVDETALFYLMSRGVPRPEAEGLLILSFLDQAVAEIEDPALADGVRAEVADWLSRRGRL